ncbi:MAG: DUF1343 domain-containing protein [Proteobacteria bacterium]|nr:DUF1343 domain-containing protein [Pseudomonadota bacterium]
MNGNDRVRTGLENFLDDPPALVRDRKLGLLFNPASVAPGLRLASQAIHERFPGMLRALFTPQHGLFASKQDNMVESTNEVDPATGIPAFSLYSHTRIPPDRYLDDVEVLLVDLLDVGTRVYTFMYTMSYCMEKAANRGIPVVVLDRPNPIGGLRLEGGLLTPAFSSFVGRYPIPMRHGLTMGELAQLFNQEFGIGCELSVMPLSGWSRDMLWQDTGLPWVPPSPNLPQAESCIVYPGQVLWEGTSLSEGRGTAMPFLQFGAPWLDTDKVLETLGETPGAILRPCAFEPTSNKFKDELCRGFYLHVTDEEVFQPVEFSLRFLEAVYALYPESFSWKPPPYEYEWDRLPADLILGTDKVRRTLEAGASLGGILKEWKQEARGFQALCAPYLIYEP